MSIRDIKKSKISLVFIGLFVLLAGLSTNVTAQKVRLRAQITPNCSSPTNFKFSDIYADGNIAVQGGYDCRGVFIYDISNPDAPILASLYNPASTQKFLEAIVVGNRGYFGSGVGDGVHIVDLTNPYNPVLLGKVNTTSGNGFNTIHEMVVWGDYLIENSNFVSSQKQIRFINISNPANPVWVRDIVPTDSGNIHAMYIRNNRMYLSGWGGKIEIFDISNVATQAPLPLGTIQGNGTQNHTSWSYDGIIHANSQQTLTASNGYAEFTFTVNPNENSNGERRFGLSSSRLDEFPDLPFTFVIKKNNLGIYVGEVVERNITKANFSPSNGDVLKISVESSAVKYYQNNQLIYTSQQTLPSQTNAPSLLVSPLFARAVLFNLNTSISGAKIFNSTNPESVVWKTPDNQVSINNNTITKVLGCDDCNYLYSCREKLDSTDISAGDLRVFDVKNPASPALIKVIKTTSLGLNASTPHNPVVMGNKLYVSWYQAGLQVFDLTNPADPKRIGQYDTYQAQFAPSDGNEDSFFTSQPWDVICGLDNFAAIPNQFNGNWAVFPFLGEDKILTGDLTNGLQILDVTKANAPLKNQVSDFDGDGKTDVSVYTPATGVWSIEKSSPGTTDVTQFGAGADKIEAGDFDGDGKSDIAVFRPSEGVWYVLGSTRGFFAAQFGANGDVPVAGDYDADGKTDFAVFRPSNGVWYIQQSTLGFRATQFGVSTDKPMIGDFEGDGKTDLAVWRPSNGTWYILQSSSSLLIGAQFGISTDKPLTGDFDGDNKTDLVVYRPGEGNWYILNSQNNSLGVYRFGVASDMPIPADYDGDGKTDVAVFRAAENAWYRLNSTNGAFVARNFGQSGDVPSPSSVQP